MPLFYTGSFTEEGTPAEKPNGKGIGCFSLDPQTGKIRLLKYTFQRNPSYLVVSEDKRYLYAQEEMAERLYPVVFSYKIGLNGNLTLINTQEIAGGYPCHLAVALDRLIIANYDSGNFLTYPILKDGSLAPFTQEIKHEGRGKNELRQEKAHVHMVYPFNKDQLYVVDLCLDQAKTYRFDHQDAKWIPVPSNDIQFEPGCGTRHMIMSKDGSTAYVLGELSGEIFVVDMNAQKKKIVQKCSIIPDKFTGSASAAAIRIHPSGHFLYASDRGSNTISIFRIKVQSGHLEFIAHQPTEGRTPRDFNIDSSGNWLVVANQDSDSLVAFEINQNDGTLKAASSIQVDTPANICWH